MKATSPIFLTLISILFLCCNSEIPVSSGYLTGADDAHIYYRVIGNAPDTIVVIHGGPGAGMHSILPSVQPLASNFTLILYDQRGGGKSVLPEDTSKLAAAYFVEDLEALREHFRLKRMNVIAHSFGAVLLARYAEKYPARFNKIVLHSATPPVRSLAAEYYMSRSAVAKPADTSLTRKASKALDSLLNGNAGDPIQTCKRYEQLSRRLVEAGGDTFSYRGTTCKAPPEAVRYYYQYTAQIAPQYFGNWDFSSSLKSLSAPMLVLHGVKDSLALKGNSKWAEISSAGQLQTIPHAGKAALSDNPDYVLPLLINFFKEN